VYDIHFCAELAGEGEFTVIPCADFGDHAQTDFLLHHDDHALEIESAVPEMEENRCGNVVGEIGNEFELFVFGEELVRQFFERMIEDVASKQGNIVYGFELIFEAGHEGSVDFDGENPVRPLVQAYGQCSQPRADFDDIVVFGQ